MRQYIRPITSALFRGLAFGAKTGPHVTRYTMYKRLSEFRDEDGASKKVLSISGSTDLASRMGFGDSEIVDTAYPDVTVLDLPYEDNTFDAIIADQVLEHVRGDPQVAFKESFRVVKPGGLVVQTTCQIMACHMLPNDYWRFTPEGLRFLAEQNGEVLEASGWGHPSIIILDILGLRHEPIPEVKWHPGNMIARTNRYTWPVVTWVVARKPL